MIISTSASADVEYLRSRQMLVPVAGADMARVEDSFNDPRDGERVHRAIDILAPRGTHVRAVEAAAVGDQRRSGRTRVVGERAGATIINTGIGWHEARIPTIVTSVPRAAFTWVTRRMKAVACSAAIVIARSEV